MKIPTTSFLYINFLFLGLFSCQTNPTKEQEIATTKSVAHELIDKAIEAHGGALYETVNVQFAFRDKKYSANRNNGLFSYTRSFTDSLGEVHDVLNNHGFYREINGLKVPLPDDKKLAYSNAVNSVLYFALLPYGLNDKQVIKEYLGEATIKGTVYHKVKITFEQEGGGEDFEDEFIYWIHPQTHKVGYLAYSFKVNEGGLRFREAINERKEKGILFYDYLNYEPLSDTTSLEYLDAAFTGGQLKKLSEIKLEELTVSVLKTKN